VGDGGGLGRERKKMEMRGNEPKEVRLLPRDVKVCHSHSVVRQCVVMSGWVAEMCRDTHECYDGAYKGKDSEAEISSVCGRYHLASSTCMSSCCCLQCSLSVYW